MYHLNNYNKMKGTVSRSRKRVKVNQNCSQRKIRWRNRTKGKQRRTRINRRIRRGRKGVGSTVRKWVRMGGNVVKVFLPNNSRPYQVGDHVTEFGVNKENGIVLYTGYETKSYIELQGYMKIVRSQRSRYPQHIWNTIQTNDKIGLCDANGQTIDKDTGTGLLQGTVVYKDPKKNAYITAYGDIRLESNNPYKYRIGRTYNFFDGNGRPNVYGEVSKIIPSHFVPYILIQKTTIPLHCKSLTTPNIAASKPNIQYIRWGIPKINDIRNTESFRIFDRTELVTNPGYILPPYEEAETFTEKQINQEKHKICDFITQLINNHMLNYLGECNPLAKFCSVPIPFPAQSITRNTLTIDSDDVDNLIIKPPNKDNPVTLVAIFCSMVKIMHKFLQSGKSHLLWIQEKGNIVDREQFNQLVDDCAMRFDVVWLWAPFQRQKGPRVQSFGNVKTQQFLHHGVGTQQNTSLNYTTMEQCQHVSCPTLGNVAVMLNQDVVKRFLLYLTQPAQFYRTENPNDLRNVNIFKKDDTLEKFVKTRVTNNRVAIVFKQNKHPIEYIEGTSSYRDSLV